MTATAWYSVLYCGDQRAGAAAVQPGGAPQAVPLLPLPGRLPPPLGLLVSGGRSPPLDTAVLTRLALVISVSRPGTAQHRTAGLCWSSSVATHPTTN